MLSMFRLLQLSVYSLSVVDSVCDHVRWRSAFGDWARLERCVAWCTNVDLGSRRHDFLSPEFVYFAFDSTGHSCMVEIENDGLDEVVLFFQLD